MDNFLAQVANIDSVGRVIRLARRKGEALGVKRSTFHLTMPHASQVGPMAIVTGYGFPPGWLESYRDFEVRRHDPVPDHVMRTGRVMTYKEALTGLHPKGEEARFIASWSETDLRETMALPIYGPFDFDTFASFSFGRPFEPGDVATTQKIVAIVEIANRRIAQLIESKTALDIPLSAREIEVLHWIGRSKSNGDIATIVGVSPSTVDTYIRRLFAKLEVNDRISAAVKGLRLGLIRY